MSDKPREFQSLLHRQPPASVEAEREATWRKVFHEHGLVWAPHNLVSPAAAACVAAETRRVQGSGRGRDLHVSKRAAVSSAQRDALIAQAESFVARRPIPAVELRPSGVVGLGLFAAEELRAGELIGEYTGLVCLLVDVEEQGAYAFEAWPSAPVAIDACTAGNHTRFVNHAPDPNLDVLQCVVGSAWHVLFMTRRAIAAGEELFFDYGDGYWRRRRMLAR